MISSQIVLEIQDTKADHSKTGGSYRAFNDINKVHGAWSQIRRFKSQLLVLKPGANRYQPVIVEEFTCFFCTLSFKQPGKTRAAAAAAAAAAAWTGDCGSK